MGRKIPGRKHRGVRDPEKQRAERFNLIKDKINAPPTDPDAQQVPKSVQRIAELRAKVKDGFYGGKKPKKDKPKERFEQRPGESDYHFMRRVNLECAVVRREAAYESKYNVEIKKNEEGEIESVTRRPKDPIRVMIKEARQKKKSKGEAAPKLTKSQKRRLKLAEKKKKKKEGEHIDGFAKFKDEVKFGEQAHAPPTLTAPRKKNANETSKPGTKNLLLKSMFDKTSNKVIDRSGKRKELPNALRRQLDQQQKEVIEAYRLIKGKRNAQN